MRLSNSGIRRDMLIKDKTPIIRVPKNICNSTFVCLFGRRIFHKTIWKTNAMLNNSKLYNKTNIYAASQGSSKSNKVNMHWGLACVL